MPESNLTAPRTTLAQKILLGIFGIFFTLIIIEISLNLGELAFLSLQEHRNAASLRRKGVYRIMCLGESTTAIGGDNSWPAQLEQILNRRNMGIKFSVINKGLPSITTIYILNNLESNLNRYKPDMVIAMMGINDRDAPSYKQNIAMPDAPEKDNFYKLKLYNLARLIWLRAKARIREIKLSIYVQNKDLDSVLLLLQEDQTLKEPIRSEDNLFASYGERYLEEGKAEQAEQFFKKAIELNPGNPRAIFGLRRCLSGTPEFYTIESLINTLLKSHPDNPTLLVELGRIYQDGNRFAEAEAMFQRATKVPPPSAWTYFTLGIFYRDCLKDPARAAESLNRAIELDPKNVHGYMELGKLYRGEGKLKLAENLFKKGIAFTKEDGMLYAALASTYEETGKPDLAVEYYEKAKESRLKNINMLTYEDYRKVKKILDERRIPLVCVQYPMREVRDLKLIFYGEKDVIFVDNESIFKDAVRRGGYKKYFSDMFTGDFGHCTRLGNHLLAGNIADTLAMEYFDRRIKPDYNQN